MRLEPCHTHKEFSLSFFFFFFSPLDEKSIYQRSISFSLQGEQLVEPKPAKRTHVNRFSFFGKHTIVGILSTIIHHVIVSNHMIYTLVLCHLILSWALEVFKVTSLFSTLTLVIVNMLDPPLYPATQRSRKR